MPYYIIQHTDYTNSDRTGDVDDPAAPYLVKAIDADRALQASYLEEVRNMKDSAWKPTRQDCDSETTVVLLDPLFDKMRKAGWVVVPPREEKEVL